MRTALAIPLIDDSRARRVAELLIVVCILSLADLIFTVWAHVVTPSDFIEVNPIARDILGHGIFGLVVMKLALTGLGVGIFWRLRRYFRAEIALWILALVYVALTFRWNSYTADVMVAMVR
jgi:hypothetical protein